MTQFDRTRGGEKNDQQLFHFPFLSISHLGCSTDVAVAETINYANGVGRSDCSANDKSEWSPDGGISRFVVSIIYNGSHTFQIGWIDSPHIGSVRERTRIGGGEEGGDIGMQRMKDRRMEEEGAGWTTHTSASNWLELFPRLISRTYLLVVVAASDRRRLHLAPDERDNFRLDCCWVRLA